ncbi:hypothetical protein ACODT5_07135 [Streptomyces sp. 5.8]|uniref:hypothetical protein n=1 Tax=Streptomyces sp. 5.8 TaxID=3406571 RepID=UPI003BB7969F
MQIRDVERQHAHAELGGDAAADQPGPIQGCVQARVDRLQAVTELSADLGQAHGPAGAADQFGADAALLLALPPGFDRASLAGMALIDPLHG